MITNYYIYIFKIFYIEFIFEKKFYLLYQIVRIDINKKIISIDFHYD